MQPFCSTSTGCVGNSKVGSPSPSDTNTLTFCRSPLASAMTSCIITGEECCLAQLGSAAILIVLANGALPSNFTTPFTVAPVRVGDGPPAFTLWGMEKQIARVTARMEITCLSFIPLHLNSKIHELA